MERWEDNEKGSVYFEKELGMLQVEDNSENIHCYSHVVLAFW